MKKLFTVILVGFVAMSAFAQAPFTLEVGGSTSVGPLMEAFAEAYRSVRPNVRININATGSGDGINNAGTLYQIGMTSRDLTPAEKGRGLTETVVARDGIAIIVHRNNPVRNLTIEQIRGIYTGTITDWSQISGGSLSGRIAVVSREAASGTRGAFEEIIGFRALVAGATEFTSTGAVRSGVATNPNAIGYISLGSINNEIRALNVGGVSPSPRNVNNGTYRIARPFILLTAGNIHAEVRDFLNWALSRQGQTVVGNRGYIPAR